VYRPSRLRRPGSGPPEESAAVAVFVAVCLLGLFAFAALAVDMSTIFNARRDDQNGADHAALAAAFAACAGGNGIAAGYASALGNGFNDDGVTNDVIVTDMGDGVYEVIIRTEDEDTFAGTLGVDGLRASARALAGCTLAGGGGSYAVFAGATDCGDHTIDWSGSTNTVVGGVHSNDGIYMGGSDNSVDGDSTAVDDEGSTIGDNNTLDPPLAQGTVLPYPVPFEIAHYEPGGSKATLAGALYYNAGNNKIDTGWLESQGLYNSSTKQLDPGIYYTTNDIDISPDFKGSVTMVTSNGKISLTGSTQQITPWDPDGLLLFSARDTLCDEYAIKMSGSTNTWEGIVYAPEGMIEMSGSGNSTFEGSLIGATVRVNGSGLQISAFEDVGGGGEPKVSLLE
jgi:hypothetical protein